MATHTRTARNKRATKTGAAATGSPLTFDELVQRDNTPAERPVPEDIAERLRRHEIHITLRDGVKLDPKRVLLPAEEELGEGVWTLAAPEGTIVGLPGRSAILDRRPASRGAAGKGVEAFHPLWVDHVYHPKLSVSPRRVMIRRKDGARVEPYYGVYGPDERQVYYPAGYPWHCIGRLFTWTNASQTNWSFYGSAC